MNRSAPRQPVVVSSPAVFAAVVGLGNTALGIAGIVGVGIKCYIALELTGARPYVVVGQQPSSFLSHSQYPG